MMPAVAAGTTTAPFHSSLHPGLTPRRTALHQQRSAVTPRPADRNTPRNSVLPLPAPAPALRRTSCAPPSATSSGPLAWLLEPDENDNDIAAEFLTVCRRVVAFFTVAEHRYHWLFFTLLNFLVCVIVSCAAAAVSTPSAAATARLAGRWHKIAT